MNYADIGIDTASLAGSLESKLAAAQGAGFTQVTISAADVVGHPGGTAAAARAVRECGLRVTGLEALRDFEGLDGQLHAYKIDVAKAMLEICDRIGSRLLLVEASTSTHADASAEAIVRDLRKLAMLAVPLGIRIAYEGLSWGRHVSEYTQAWEIVDAADHPNLGLGKDSFHVLATATGLDAFDLLDPDRIFLVQLADFMWQETRSSEERMNTARHFRVFPGEGVHSAQVAELVRQLDEMGYRGDYSFEVFNDDYVQLPLAVVAERARASVKWLTGQVPRRSLPVRRTPRRSAAIPGA